MTWQRPSKLKCPQCKGYMLEKGKNIVCDDEECGYVISRDKLEEMEEEAI